MCKVEYQKNYEISLDRSWTTVLFLFSACHVFYSTSHDNMYIHVTSTKWRRII